MLLILKIIKIFKKYYHPSWLCGSMLPHNHDGLISSTSTRK